jgi:hypothetical protein
MNVYYQRVGHVTDGTDDSKRQPRGRAMCAGDLLRLFSRH